MSAMNLSEVLKSLPSYREVLAAVKTGRTPFLFVGLSHVHKAFVSAALREHSGFPALLVAPDEPTAIRLAEDVRGFQPSFPVYYYPAKEIMLRDTEAASREYETIRLTVLEALANAKPGPGAPLVVASAEAALQYTISPSELVRRSFVLKGSFAGGPQELVRRLTAAGYERSEQVEGVCTFAVRGGIVDFFSPAASEPCRVEFWGDEVDGIHFFSAETQRRTEPVDELMISPAREALPPDCGIAAFLENCKGRVRKGSPAGKCLQKEAERVEAGLSVTCLDRFLPLLYPENGEERGFTLLDYLPGGLMLLSDPVAARETVRSVSWQLSEDVAQLLDEGLCFPGCDRYAGDFDDLMCALSDARGVVLDTFARSIPDLRFRGSASVTALALAPWGGELETLLEDLRPYLRRNLAVAVMLPTKRGCEALLGDLANENIPASYSNPPVLKAGTATLTDMTVSGGFEFPEAVFAAISHVKAAAPPRKTKKRRSADAVRSLSDLSAGDYVVHATHGIGQFEGIVKREVMGVVKDYIRIRYQGSDLLFVPVTQLDLVSKYIGKSEDGIIRLNKLGSDAWQKTRSRVKSAVKDMAKELMALYKKRMDSKGFAFSEDNDWQRDFETRFPYDETDDQLRCIEEIKQDMQAPRPMDRLLCGDVGFGKTEVALRAAFKCVLDSKQCAVLVPTTILAWQHYQTFTRRMEGFPVRVELLSRFRSAKEQAEIIKDLKRGTVDVVIGTHRLIQKDVEYKDLGLCIIDEEQRFGVAHKERFKELRASVDVLTLSATPIPRTLNMAMSGMRDMSIIEEAPQDRHPVQTYVLEHDWGVLGEAIRRELRRGGQVFYLHNRIESIDGCARRVRELIPDARVVVAHGQMGEEQLSKIWQGLVDHEIDILVCTTIIETGVDVPNCNTLIIENADRMGLSQLYQLRVRVGRSSRRAYAYFTFHPSKVLTEVASKRLSAIKEFTSFGSGFRIAMRDMEIRGAGNVLGAQQHGHMDAVGYDMYLRLLSEAISEEKGEPVRKTAECTVDIQIDAHIPETYIENLAQRLDVYKKIAAVTTEEESRDVMDELIDRFGDPPQTVAGLLEVALIRNCAANAGIREISQRGEGKDGQILLFPERLDPFVAASIAAAMPGRALVNAGQKPYISVKIGKDGDPIGAVKEALAAVPPQAPS